MTAEEKLNKYPIKWKKGHDDEYFYNINQMTAVVLRKNTNKLFLFHEYGTKEITIDEAWLIIKFQNFQ